MGIKKVKTRNNPVETSNILSFLLFGYSIPIFWKGRSVGLEITDLYDPLKSDESKRLGDRLEREWEKELRKETQVLPNEEYSKEKRQKKPNLVLPFVRIFWIPFSVLGFLTLFEMVVLRMMPPVLQGLVISYFNPGEPRMKRNEVLIYAGLLLIFTLGHMFMSHQVNLRSKRIGMCVRVACCSLIYRKVLKLNMAKVSNTVAGQVANLISNDVARFDDLFTVVHYLWIMPIQVSLVGLVMWKSVKIATLVGIGTIFMQAILIQGYLSVLIVKLRSEIAVKTDQRVQLISELISGMQVVKMYCWEKPFSLMVNKYRSLEMKIIGWASFQKALHITVMIVAEKVTLYFTVIAFIMMGNILTAETTFALSTFFAILRVTCTHYFPLAMVMTGEAAASLERVTEFLLLDEVECPETIGGSSNYGSISQTTRIKGGIGIELIDVTANWVQNQLPATFCKVSMKVKNGSLCGVVGSVGSGKSSLLHLLLGELKVESGKLSLFSDEIGGTTISSSHIRVSYASQDPWLFSASVRDNILFGQPYDEQRYKEVTRVCALDKDFEQLPQGDLSFVGERGASLSGGQRARVNLARAVYKDADLYLLDDPLSAVDPRVGRHLFEECVTRFLQGKTRILVTHQLQYLWQTDHVVVLNAGTVKYQGTYEEVVKSESHPLDCKNSEKNEHENINTEDNAEFKTVTETPLNDDAEKRLEPTGCTEESEDVEEEEKESGCVSIKVYRDYFLAGGNICSLVILTVIIIAAEFVMCVDDYWLTLWTNQEILRTTASKSYDFNMTHCNESRNNNPVISYSWFDACGFLSQISGIYIYTLLVFGCISINLLQCKMFMKTCMKASRKIHDSMVANLLKAPIRFFNVNPSGRILNRFSKDVGTMDESIPGAMLTTILCFKAMFAIFWMVIIIDYWMVIPSFVLGFISWLICVCYLKTAQDVKRFEAIARSPLFSHVNATFDGLTTIRSRGKEASEILREEFDSHQDKHTGAWYLYIVTSVAFAFFVDLVSAAFIGCVCFSLILMNDGDTRPGFVGLAISQSLMLPGSIEFGLTYYSMVVSYMTSVERVLQYTNLPTEGPLTTENPPPSSWPSKGSLIVKNLTMRYAEDKPPALKNVNAIISPGWKVGVVGRTGAGKSSLISALLRLTSEGLEGEIILDDIETGAIGLHELRPRISIIPQEPILFSATLRYNLDPFDEYEDSKLWDSLREVELGHVVASLDSPVAAAGANFSVGQRQLICLARALLRNNRILVLDEATANIDQSTDALIQRTIRRRFADCTVLTIAHRLNTIMDSDRVLVMSEGEIVEFDHPHLLLENKVGYFSQMVEQTGNAMAKILAADAEAAYLLNPEFSRDCGTASTYL